MTPAARAPRKNAAAEPASTARWEADEHTPPVQPTRPVVIEVGSAVLIAAGAFRLAAILIATTNPNPPYPINPGIAVVEVGLQILTIVVGLLARTGRAWILVINVTAILTFLEILSLPSPVSFVLAILFGLGFAGAFLNKPWFDATASWRTSAQAAHP